MKLTTTLSKLLLLLTVTAFIATGCGNNNDGKIAYDEANASKEVITIGQAKALQKKFMAERSVVGKKVTDSFLNREFNLPNAETFGRDAIALLLNQGADSIRIYYGLDSLGKCRLVLLPVDKMGKDMYKKLLGHKKETAITIPGVSSAKAQESTGDEEAVETGQICPPCLIDGH
jgi:hypothetical protein